MSEGGRAEFEGLLMEHLGPAEAFARRLSGDRAEAEELVQEASLRAHREFDRFERGTSFRAWLFRMVREGFVGRHPERRAEPPALDFDRLEGRYERLVDESRIARLPSPEEALSQAILAEDVSEGLAAMPEEYRLVLHLCLLEGFSYREAADILELPTGTVMSRLHRGRKFLQGGLLERARHRGGLQVEGAESAAEPGGSPS